MSAKDLLSFHVNRCCIAEGAEVVTAIDETHTTFGTVVRGADGTRITATGGELGDWARNPYASWPCSGLARLEWVRVDFDAKGDLVDIDSSMSYEEWEVDGPLSDELNAWSSDVLVRAGYPNHPAIRKEA